MRIEGNNSISGMQNQQHDVKTEKISYGGHIWNIISGNKITQTIAKVLRFTPYTKTANQKPITLNEPAVSVKAKLESKKSKLEKKLGEAEAQLKAKENELNSLMGSVRLGSRDSNFFEKEMDISNEIATLKDDIISSRENLNLVNSELKISKALFILYLDNFIP